jgi:hypothetical protein
MMLDWMPEAIVEKCERVIVLSQAREYCQAQAENHLARYSMRSRHLARRKM